MSHRIIITSRAMNLGSLAAADLAAPPQIVEYDITYTPDHDATPAQQGAKVAQILRLCERMQQPVGE